MRKPVRSSSSSTVDVAAVFPELPAVGEGKRGERGYLGYLLRQAHAASRLAMERTLADLGVTSPQFMVLTLLVAYPGISSADLARLAFLTPQTVSVIVANLEKRDAIARRPHAVHGRIRLIEVSETGRALLATCRERVRRLEARLRDGLSEADEQVIRLWLVRVAQEDGDAA
jgi:DNA-binding MarR family transcriptional regulator